MIKVLNPFAWIEAFSRHHARAAWKRGAARGIAEAAQELALELTVGVDVPALADLPPDTTSGPLVRPTTDGVKARGRKGGKGDA